MNRLLIVSILTAARLAAADDFVALRLPAGRVPERMASLLRSQTRYLVGALPQGEIANEQEYAIRALTSTAYTAAACLKLTGCDEPARTRDAVIALLQKLTRVHVTGGGSTSSGKPWGDHWQSAFWAYQAAFAGWLLWSDLPPDVRQAVVRMAVHEADRFIDLPPPASEFLDTKAEENSWNSMVQALVAAALPNHPHAARWRRRADEYMMSAFATRADVRSGAAAGANMHDDFTLENHGFVHPDYMTTVSMNLTNALVDRALGRPVSRAALHHVAAIYENLKFLTLPDGSLFYPNNTDWNLHNLGHTFNLHILAERILQDGEAGALAERALETLEKMRTRNRDGRLWIPGEYRTYPAMEQHAGFLIASAAVAVALWPPPANPKPIEGVWKRLEGARFFDDAHLFVARGPKGIHSAAWGPRILAQSIPFDRDPVLYPLNRSYVGIVGPTGGDPTQPGGVGVTSAAIEHAAARDSMSIATAIPAMEAGAASVTVLSRRGPLRHQFSFTALPQGKSVYMERCSGAGGPIRGGLVALLEEPDWVWTHTPREIRRGPNWLNVDGRLGFVLQETARLTEERHYHSRILFLNDDAQSDAVAVIVTIPGAAAAETEALAAASIRVESGSAAIAGVVVDGMLIATNFSQHPATAGFRIGPKLVAVPVSGYATRVLRVR